MNSTAPKLQPTWLDEVLTAAKQEVQSWPDWKKPSSLQRREEEGRRPETVSLRQREDRKE
jgi:hypothetical protein